MNMKVWTCGVLFSMLPPDTIVRVLQCLLLEKTLVIVGAHLGMVSVAGTALLSLLEPFCWEGIFVPVSITLLFSNSSVFMYLDAVSC
jgi:DENN (AEX-3) domain